MTLSHPGRPYRRIKRKPKVGTTYVTVEGWITVEAVSGNTVIVRRHGMGLYTWTLGEFQRMAM